MDCCIATSSRAKFSRPTASLEGPKSKPHYRRSTTTKAPRKRTFIMNMEKYNPGVRSEGAGGMLCKVNAAASSELLQTCCGGNDGINMGGNGGTFVRRLSGNPGGDSNSFRGAQPLPRAVVLGAAALLAGLVFLPSQAVASSAFRSTSRVAALPLPSSGPRNMCLNNTCLVEPGTPLPDNAIIYGQVQLTEAERRLIGGRQLFFRETLRCEALSL